MTKYIVKVDAYTENECVKDYLTFLIDGRKELDKRMKGLIKELRTYPEYTENELIWNKDTILYDMSYTDKRVGERLRYVYLCERC